MSDPQILPVMYGDTTLPDLQRIRLERATRHLHHFMRYSWASVEPKPLNDGWHLSVICEHLEAVWDNQIRNLIINVPPRHTKSLTVSVFWPAWCWLRDPSYRFLCTSYSDALSIRDSVRCRRLIDSPRYQDLMAYAAETREGYEGFSLTDDQNAKRRYDTDKGGYRLVTTILGQTTGEGGDSIIVDDPHNIMHNKRELKIEEVQFWWDEVMGTRKNEFATGHFIIIMQRCHEGDLSGHVEATETDGDWTLLKLPMRYEGHRVVSYTIRPPLLDAEGDRLPEDQQTREPSVLGTLDYRQAEGQILCPDRFPEDEVKRLERKLGDYGRAGQLQQRPAPREGGMFKPAKIAVLYPPPMPAIVRTVRYWDKAGTAGGGAYTAGVKMAELSDGRTLLMDVVRGQWDPFEREVEIRRVAEQDGPDVEIFIEQEPASSGKESAMRTITNLKGWKVEADRPTGDKTVRAEPYASQVNGGGVLMLPGQWHREYLRELGFFPNGSYRDQVDGSSGAFNKLYCVKRKRAGVPGK